MFLYHGHRNEARRQAVGPGPNVMPAIASREGRGRSKEWGYMWITDWTARAACKGTDPDELFVQGAAQNRAKLICRGCPVRTECLADALDNRIEFGVWGGMTERERRALLRRRPDVRSWRELLEDARNTYERGADELVAS
jgi:WhiB family redox-sensing transcriptional regulator